MRETLIDVLKKYFTLQKIIGVCLKQKYIFFQGRGPRTDTSLHLGHLLLYSKLNEIVKKTKSKYIFQISDDEKRLYTQSEQTYSASKKIYQLLLHTNVTTNNKECAINHAFINTDVYSKVEPIARVLSSLVSIKHISKIFGPEMRLYDLNYFCLQIAPIVYASFEYPDRQTVCVVAEDQEKIFCLARDMCKKVGLTPPLIIVIQPLYDIYLKNKMSSKDSKSCVFFDNYDKVKKSISGEKDFCTHLLVHLKPLLKKSKYTFLKNCGASKNFQKLKIIEELHNIFNFSQLKVKKTKNLFRNYKQVFKKYCCYDQLK